MTFASLVGPSGNDSVNGQVRVPPASGQDHSAHGLTQESRARALTSWGLPAPARERHCTLVAWRGQRSPQARLVTTPVKPCSDWTSLNGSPLYIRMAADTMLMHRAGALA